MMESPLIGITTRREDEKYTVSVRYAASVRHAGGQPLLIPPDEPEIEKLLERLDGVILSGGGDIAPSFYRGSLDATIYGVDAKRDETEIRIVRYALSTALPLLGICRGIQVMNVAMGGTLIPHLPDVVGEKVKHRLPGDEGSSHPVTLCPGSLLSDIVEAETFDVPSYHHQAIQALPSLLRPTAHAPDGVIEAVELGDHPFFIGVQWHPERSDDVVHQKIFDAIIKAASQAAAHKYPGVLRRDSSL